MNEEAGLGEVRRMRTTCTKVAEPTQELLLKFACPQVNFVHHYHNDLRKKQSISSLDTECLKKSKETSWSKLVSLYRYSLSISPQTFHLNFLPLAPPSSIMNTQIMLSTLPNHARPQTAPPPPLLQLLFWYFLSLSSAKVQRGRQKQQFGWQTFLSPPLANFLEVISHLPENTREGTGGCAVGWGEVGSGLARHFLDPLSSLLTRSYHLMTHLMFFIKRTQAFLSKYFLQCIWWGYIKILCADFSI